MRLTRLLNDPGCSKIDRSSHSEQAPRRRSSATPHKAACEDGGEMAVFGQPVRSIAFKLILVITVCSTLIFAVTLGYNYYRSRQLLERGVEESARNIVRSSVNRVETVLAAVGKVTDGMATSLETGAYPEPALFDMLRRTVMGNAEVYGACAAFEPKDADSRPYAPYFYRNRGKLVYVPEDSFEYLRQDWYQIPKELGQQEWTEPYFDVGGGNILMTSCSVPFYRGNGASRRLRGVVTVDVSLEWLADLVSSIKVLKTGYAFLLSRNGAILTHPNKAMIMNETIFSLAEANNNPRLREIGRKMIRGEEGFIPYTDLRGVESWMYYAPIPSTGWTLAVLFPKAELLAEVRSLTVTVAAMGLAGILLLTLAVVFIARSITTPLRGLAAATEVIAAGDFEAELPPVRTRDEVGMLAQAFRTMRDSLKEYIQQLTETTAAKERIQSELKVATDIQASLLPRIFPAFPDRAEFDIYARMDPAKEVGGDFYDFFFTDDQHLCFLIADVSDKGVPAALYMMAAKTLLKTEAVRGLPPDQILFRVNNLLAPDNDSCMFVTVFCAILDTASGELQFANAGHNPPLLCSGGDGFHYLKVQAGFVLGPMADSAYVTETVCLQPGDIFFLYTDGVTEAKNPESRLFGEERLLQAVQEHCGDTVTDLIQVVRGEVQQFAASAPQSDDVTMLAVKFRGNGKG